MSRENTLVVVGGGLAAGKAAEELREHGHDGPLLVVGDEQERPYIRPPLSKGYLLGKEDRESIHVHPEGWYREHGVDLRPHAQIERVTGTGGRVTGVRLADGSHLPADAVVVGVGIAPNVRLAEEAGLEVRNGIVTDEHLRTSMADIHAAGDVANAYHPRLGRHLRVEHWANALHQPRTAALSMLGKDAVYDRLPYFYTDQYDLGMEYTGYAQPGGYDRVVFRGARDERRFIAFWMSGNRVLAGMSVNVWDVIGTIRSVIESGVETDDAVLSDPAVPLESLLP